MALRSHIRAVALLTSLMILAPATAREASAPLLSDARAVERSHDARLPAWGPYSNAYLGLSHVADRRTGMRFDVTVVAGLHTTSRPNIPNASLNTGFHAWEAAPGLEHYAFRQQVNGRRVYADTSFTALDARTRIIRAGLVNAHDRTETVRLDLIAAMQLPNRAPNEVLTPRRILRASLPEGGRWISGVHYAEFTRGIPQPQDGLVYDGWLRGEVRGDGRVDGRSLRFGTAAGDRAVFALPAGRGDVVTVRYRADRPVRLRAEGLTLPTLDLPATTGGTVVAALAPGARSLTLFAPKATPLELDGLALTRTGTAPTFQPEQANTTPVREAGPVANSLLLKYPQSDTHYGLRWFTPGVTTREFRHGVLDGFFPRNAIHKTQLIFQGDGRGHYTDLSFPGIDLKPGERAEIWAIVVAGTRAEVEAALRAAPVPDRLRARWTAARAGVETARYLPAAESYRLARQIIAATVLTNVTYPVYTQDQYIRHLTPGKWWDSLYTWDSGFIGLGLVDIDPRLSFDVLNAYTTPPGSQSAFIHHGTPLPVQHSQYLELWNRTGDRAMLAYLYPRLRRHYEFLVGRSGGSTTARLRSGLLATWDYFYNSGGWDDLPPQVRVHENKLTPRIAPMVTTAHVIRAAKILRMAAEELGRRSDVTHYDADVARLSGAVLDNGWDAATGYFGYVLHDEAGQPIGLLRTANGENANKTLDGVSPLVSGITSTEQTAAMLRNLKDPARLATPMGITAVDRSASYYRPDGYWNGTVWFPHQWFMWKALLDQGEHAYAWQVARTALALYQREAEADWSSYEHFQLSTGRGVGWHQFSGLSAPIANWFSSYFELGRLSTGYDLWVRAKRDMPGHRGMTADLRVDRDRRGGTASVVAVVAPGRYRATWNGHPVEAVKIHPGAYSIQIPLSGARDGRLRVEEAR